MSKRDWRRLDVVERIERGQMTKVRPVSRTATPDAHRNIASRSESESECSREPLTLTAKKVAYEKAARKRLER